VVFVTLAREPSVRVNARGAFGTSVRILRALVYILAEEAETVVVRETTVTLLALTRVPAGHVHAVGVSSTHVRLRITALVHIYLAAFPCESLPTRTEAGCCTLATVQTGLVTHRFTVEAIPLVTW